MIPAEHIFDVLAVAVMAWRLLAVSGARRDMMFEDVFGCVAVGTVYYLGIRLAARWAMPAGCESLAGPAALIAGLAPLLVAARRKCARERAGGAG